MQRWGRGRRGQGPQAARRTNAAALEVHPVNDEEELNGGGPVAGRLSLLRGVQHRLGPLPLKYATH
jgi:hypothetical protein